MPIVTEVPFEYLGREQTWIKHLILKQYLEKLAYKILSFRTDLVYIDGFSGPWGNRGDDFSDTSFGIAVKVLRDVKATLQQSGKTVHVRCVFVEQDAGAYEHLEAAARAIVGTEVFTFRGSFESAVPKIVPLLHGRFALTFIDPTGWTGYSLDKIQPLLTHQPSEVLVNFMFSFINRFLGNARSRAQLTPILGGLAWEQRLRTDLSREDAIVDLFRRSLKEAGQFARVLATPIANPNADRTHFYLVYGTRHPEGLRVFRDTERQALLQQDIVRENLFRERRKEKTGMADLFTADAAPAKRRVENEIRESRSHARRMILDRVAVPGQVLSYEAIWVEVLEEFSLREIEVNGLVRELVSERMLTTGPLPPRARALRDDTVVWRV